MCARLQQFLVPALAALGLLIGGLAHPLQAASGPAASAAALPPPGLTEAQLKSALAGKTLIRTDTRGFQRVVATHGAHGRLITGPALAALLSQGPSRVAVAGAPPPSSGPACAQADSLARLRCWDSLARVRDATPRALRETGGSRSRDTVYVGEEGDGEDPDAASRHETPEDIEAARTRGYFGRFFVDLSDGGSDWDAGDWAVVLYVVIGVVVVGAFVLAGGKALYDLIVNKDAAPVFKEAGLRMSWSGLAMEGDGGSRLYRDAWLSGARFALGVDKGILSLGLAAEGGWIDLSVSGFGSPADAVEYRGGYLLGGPMVRFGDYRPLALTLEFLNGTSDHRSIGWISKSRLALAGRTPLGATVGAHLGAVFFDLRLTDGLVFRRGDLNRDLSLLAGLDLGWTF